MSAVPIAYEPVELTEQGADILRLMRENSELKAENAALRQQLDSRHPGSLAWQKNEAVGELNVAWRQIRELEAENAELRTALEPLALASRQLKDAGHPAALATMHVNVAHKAAELCQASESASRAYQCPYCQTPVYPYSYHEGPEDCEAARQRTPEE